MENTTIQNELKRGVFKPYYLIRDLKPAKVNRDLYNFHAVKFKNKLKQNDWLSPVIVSDKGDVIEGHHRIESAKLLGQLTVPAYIVSWVNTTVDKDHLNCIISLNNGNRAWNTLDYLKAFSRENNDYKIVYDAYKVNSNNISVGNIVHCYFTYKRGYSNNFKKGTAKINDKNFADYLVNKFSYLNKEYGKNKIAAYCVRELIYVAYVKCKKDKKSLNFLFRKYEDMAKTDHPSITSINKFKPLMELYLNEYNMIKSNK